VGTTVLLVPNEVFVENSVMVAPADKVREVSNVTAPVTSSTAVIFVGACNSIVAAPMGFNIILALDDVVISLFSIKILLIVVNPFRVPLVICGEVNVSAVLSSPYNSAKLSLIFWNAVRNGSPVPSLAFDPMLMFCFAILNYLAKIL
jgi:hypothetical protein